MKQDQRLIERYQKAKADCEADNDTLFMNLMFGCGFLMGADMPGCAAALMVAGREALGKGYDWPDFK